MDKLAIPKVIFPSGSGVKIHEIKYNGQNYHATLWEDDSGGWNIVFKGKAKTIEGAILSAYLKTAHYRWALNHVPIKAERMPIFEQSTRATGE